MDKKKVGVCTALFATVLVGFIVATFFIKSADGVFRLCYPVMTVITGAWTICCVEKFYNWLIK